LLGVFGPGAFAIFGGGVDFSAFTTVGGAGVSTTVDVGGGVIEVIGVSAGGSEAHAVTTKQATATSENRKRIATSPATKMP